MTIEDVTVIVRRK